MFYDIEKGTGTNYNPNPPFADYLENKSMIIEQSTGLTDKNGKEIFEGDVVRMEYPAGYSLLTVRFGQFDNGLDYDDNDSGNGWYVSVVAHCSDDEPDHRIESFGHEGAYSWCKDIEVIGNIHENPELVKP